MSTKADRSKARTKGDVLPRRELDLVAALALAQPGIGLEHAVLLEFARQVVQSGVVNIRKLIAATETSESTLYRRLKSVQQIADQTFDLSWHHLNHALICANWNPDEGRSDPFGTLVSDLGSLVSLNTSGTDEAQLWASCAFRMYTRADEFNLSLSAGPVAAVESRFATLARLAGCDESPRLARDLLNLTAGYWIMREVQVDMPELTRTTDEFLAATAIRIKACC